MIRLTDEEMLNIARASNNSQQHWDTTTEAGLLRYLYELVLDVQIKAAEALLRKVVEWEEEVGELTVDGETGKEGLFLKHDDWHALRREAGLRGEG